MRCGIKNNDFAPPKAAYVHIPFCRRRCFYCDFPISVVGDRTRGDESQAIQRYVMVLIQEIAATPNQGQSLTTVFFGGGTPSLLSVNQLERILTALEQQFGIASNAEISMEIDPGTFTLEQVQGYRSAGVTRVSLGVQAFQSELLQLCGRSHTVEEIYTAVDRIRQAAIPSLNLDLISGLPHQTMRQWQDSLQAAVAIAPDHLSLYDLTVEPVTAFGRRYQPGEAPLPSDTTATEMYRTAQQELTKAGYEHYEISNYAKPGHQCRHNRVYWENRPYYGFGMGAASYVQGQRFTRPRKTVEYYPWVENLVATGGAIDCPVTPDYEVLLDTLMLGLRLAEGLSLAELRQRFGGVAMTKVWQALQPHGQAGLVQVVDEGGTAIACGNWAELPTTGRVRLSDPEGFLLSNVVLSDLFAFLDEE